MPIGGQFRVDPPVLPDEVFLRAINQLHEGPDPTRMPHELKPKALALVSALNEPRHINDHELAVPSTRLPQSTGSTVVKG